ncbi:RsiW anti- sigma factor protease PrsW [Gottschalkia acidurici 9a]|uniref:Protease PrsW n=1 Tax=Gottschalkia acidurici (strain ATCC 7906 / DSM 604 / BCRC 14475 / CIP 104303 / KCTC 5404 / NCIMB 10678 / 9a) TaxID=1128398 RepID=K0AZG9_GOTA9|nr:PrsW family glutamic-type intramembrane protease [Gottschalkia acidurici]AFS79193.1 RsiW anti- sigma factor protease PrsW [Gottschalkia acidurici 9a]
MNILISKLLLIAIAPAISIAIVVYISDKYEKEPIHLLIKTFILGALSVIPTLIVERALTIFNIFPGLIGVFYTSFIVAGFTEEFFKRSVIVNFIYKNKNYNERLDGIVYSIFSALGFATIENIMYVVFRFNYNAYVGLYRGILSVPAHCIFAVSMGYYLSLAKYSKDEVKKRSYLRKSLYIPVILHGIFDFILMSNVPLYSILFIPYAIYLWRSNQKRIDRYILESKNNNEDK